VTTTVTASEVTAALVLEGVRAMSPAERNELRELLDGGTAGGEDRWIDSHAAAAYLGMHRDTLRKLAATGVIPSEQASPGCKRYFRISALDQWRESGGGFHAASMPLKTAARVGD
jgi:excisionase family DNA binding protein